MRWDGPWVKHKVLPAKRKLVNFLWVCDSPSGKNCGWMMLICVWGSRTIEIGSKKLPPTIEFSILGSHCHSIISVVWDQYHSILGRLFSWFRYSWIINELLTTQFLTFFQPERAVLGDNLFLFYVQYRFSFHAQFGSLYDWGWRLKKYAVVKVMSHKNVTTCRLLPCGMLCLSLSMFGMLMILWFRLGGGVA